MRGVALSSGTREACRLRSKRSTRPSSFVYALGPYASGTSERIFKSRTLMARLETLHRTELTASFPVGGLIPGNRTLRLAESWSLIRLVRVIGSASYEKQRRAE